MKPQIIGAVADNDGTRSAYTVITCTVQSNPVSNISLSGPGGSTICFDSSVCMLNVSKPGAENVAYVCVASNMYGEDRKSVFIQSLVRTGTLILWHESKSILVID